MAPDSDKGCRGADNFKGSCVPGHKTTSASLELGTNRTFLILLGARKIMIVEVLEKEETRGGPLYYPNL